MSHLTCVFFLSLSHDIHDIIGKIKKLNKNTGGIWHMNYEKIKELVIDDKWDHDAGKYGDDYRSLIIQIDNFIKHLKNEDSPIQWLSLIHI